MSETHSTKPSKQRRSRKFYAQQTAQSRVKAEIITKYAASRAGIISGSGVLKVVYTNLWAGRGRYDDNRESTLTDRDYIRSHLPNP